MAFEVMDGHRGTSPGKSETAGNRPSDEQCPDQSGSGGVCDPVELVGLRGGFAKCRMNEWQQSPDVIPRRQLGHDSAVFGMHLHLAVQAMGEQPGLAVVRTKVGHRTNPVPDLLSAV